MRHPVPLIFSALAEDNHGAQSAFSPVLTVVSSPGTNNPPTVTITSPSFGATVSGYIHVQGTAGDSDGTVTQVEVSIDSGGWWTVSGTTSWTTSWDTTTVGDGSHTISARSKDNKGASSTFISVSVTVSNAGNSPPKTNRVNPLAKPPEKQAQHINITPVQLIQTETRYHYYLIGVTVQILDGLHQ